MYANALTPGHYREVGSQDQMLGAMPKQPPVIAMALEHLEKELHGLRESVRTLEQRLAPVMRPVPEANSASTCGSAGSPLACQIESLTHLLRMSSADVRGMLDCLEL
jgi:archaellum component FlaC